MARGLYTDLYELRMVESYIRRGMTEPATFSLYIRPTPQRPWFVALGVDRALDFIDAFGYDTDDIAYLSSVGIHPDALAGLAELRPSGQVWAVPDGTLVLADEPFLEVTAPLPFAQLIETAMINLIQYPTLVATKAARVALAAQGRPVVDFGFRRAHGLETGVEGSLAAHIGGGLSTSNVEAGRRYGIPTLGTMAHSFVQAHANEIDAFRAFAEDHPSDTTLLVDTYDTLDGVRNAIVIAQEMRDRGQRLRAIRLDSGDLDVLARSSRGLMDDAGFPEIEILASGGLDEFEIARLLDVGAPIDAFGVGTDLVVSIDRPAVDIAYKLVAYDGRPVAKQSSGKATLPGAKQVFRTAGPENDVLGLRNESEPGALLEVVWRDGDRVRGLDIAATRGRVEEALLGLPDDWKRLSSFDVPPVPRLSEGLRALSERVSGPTA
ncbi:MAG: nicotinate phosphoribosyltransferase [Actinomycetota bacterium]